MDLGRKFAFYSAVALYMLPIGFGRGSLVGHPHVGELVGKAVGIVVIVAFIREDEMPEKERT